MTTIFSNAIQSHTRCSSAILIQVIGAVLAIMPGATQAADSDDAQQE
jgi:hypothetical protein